MACAFVGAALAAAAGSVVELTAPAALVGGLNGTIGGWRQTYRWTSLSGPAAFLLDSTWALLTTAAALVTHAVAAVQRTPDGYVDSLSRRSNRHVYVRGLTVRAGFLTTLGNVVSGAGTASASPRRRRVVTDHEDIHVWQARCFGPLFPLLYAAWLLLGGVVGGVTWLIGGRRTAFARTVEAWAYYRNPFEWWAYSREGRWPPPRTDASLVWRAPMSRPRSRSTSAAA